MKSKHLHPEQSFLSFVRYSLRKDQLLPNDCKEIDWLDYYQFSRRQGIAGLIFNGLERSGLKIPQEVLFEWVGTMQVIKSTNLLVDKRCHQISRFWEKQGYRNCILKGQANATMYPRPELRSPGDIDIWVDGETTKLIKIAQRVAPEGHYSLHHVTIPVFNDTSVEVHYRPVFLDNWWKDKKLQRYIDKAKDAQFGNKITLGDGKTEVRGLTDEFNAVFLLLHMWHHLLSTRNNLKQFIDYYYLLKREFTASQREAIACLFEELGVLKYARGVMWVEHEALGLERERLLVEPDEAVGRLLLRETIHYGEKEEKHNKMSFLLEYMTNNAKLFRHFPSSVLIAPIYLIWHQWWKLKMNYRLKEKHRGTN